MAKVTNDNIISVKVSADEPINYGWTAARCLRPSESSIKRTFVWPLDPGGDYTPKVTNVIAATSFSLYRRYGGLRDATLIAYREPCPASGSGSCVSTDPHGDHAVYLSHHNGTNKKFQISHELGHLIARKRDDNLRANTSGYDLNWRTVGGASHCADGDSPFNHHFGSEEYASSAANEGLAHFYAAAVWNHPAEGDCKWYSYYDGSIVDCEAGAKFLIDDCYGGEEPGIPSGNELDWMRFWWDVHSDCDITFGPIMDIWDAADPHTWSDDNVVIRLLVAAYERLDLTDYLCLASKRTSNGIVVH